MSEAPTITTKRTRKPAEGAKEELESLFTIPADETPDDIAIDNLMTEFQSVDSAEVRIHRVLPNNKLSYLCTVHPNEFRFDDLRDVYEGGKFRVFVYGIDEDGKKQLRSARQFDIEKPKQIVQPIQQQNNTSDIAAVIAQSMTGLGQLIIQSNENLAKLIAANAQQNQQPVIDPITMQNNFLNQMIAMKQLFAVPAPVVTEDKSVTEKMIETLSKGIELGKSLGEVRGEASSTDVLLETVKGFAPAIMSAMAQGQQPQAQPHQVHRPAPPVPQVPHNVPPVPSVPLNNQENQDMNFIKLQQIKMGLNFLVSEAEKNTNPQAYSEMVLNNLSDDDIDEIFGLEKPIDYFSQIEPKILNHSEWFNTLINDMKSLLTEEGETVINDVSLMNSGQHEVIINPNTEGNPASDS